MAHKGPENHKVPEANHMPHKANDTSHKDTSHKSPVKKTDSKGSFQTIYAEGSFTPQILERRGYKLEFMLGKGAFSDVFKGTYKNPKTGHMINIAIKVIDRGRVPKDWETVRLPIELKVAKQIDHIHIIKYIGSPIKTHHKAYIFMELCFDSMDKLLSNYPHGFPEKHCQTWYQQLATALAYLTRQGIAHRDLKTENILLDNSLNVKLTDFSFAFFCFDKDNHKEVLASTFCGTSGYKSPEIYNGKPYDALKADVWSSGCILYELMFHHLPFPVDEHKMEDKFIVKLLNYKRYPLDKKGPGQPPTTVECKALIHRLLEPDATKRITMQQILRDNWFKVKLQAKPIVINKRRSPAARASP